MVSRTLLQLLTLSIIFTDQIKARCLNKIHSSVNLDCTLNNKSAYKHSARVNEIDEHDENSNALQHRYRINRIIRKQSLTNNEPLKNNDDSDALSKENEIYKLENRVDIPSIETSVTEKVKSKHKSKFSQNSRKQKLHNDKTKHKTTITLDSDEVISKKDKPTEKKGDALKGGHSVNSEDTLDHDEAEPQTSSFSKHDEKESLESTEEITNLPKKQRLPFYVTSPKQTQKEITKKHPKRPIQQKDEKDAVIMSDNLEKKLTGKTDSRPETIDLEKMMNQLASSRILDFLTDKVADHMLKKLEDNPAFKSHFTTTEPDPEKVEKIDILFKNDGDMVLMKNESVISTK